MFREQKSSDPLFFGMTVLLHISQVPKLLALQKFYLISLLTLFFKLAEEIYEMAGCSCVVVIAFVACGIMPAFADVDFGDEQVDDVLMTCSVHPNQLATYVRNEITTITARDSGRIIVRIHHTCIDMHSLQTAIIPCFMLCIYPQ